MENYEQKYKELIEKLQTAKEKSGGYTFSSVIDAILLELKESEDERIRKEIIQSIQDNMCVIHKDKCIAWLEKQGEQNHAWSEEDELMIKDAIHWINEFQKSNRCKDENDMQNSVTCENWLKSLQDRVQLQPKQEWSEEDERIYQSIVDDTVQENQLDSNQLAWIKSLKDRVLPQSKQEWNEVSDSMIEGIKIAILDYYDKENAEEIIDWLKSLKPQNHWKPSEEQLEALWNAIPHIPNSEKDLDTITELSALYEELKSL